MEDKDKKRGAATSYKQLLSLKVSEEMKVDSTFPEYLKTEEYSMIKKSTLRKGISSNIQSKQLEINNNAELFYVDRIPSDPSFKERLLTHSLKTKDEEVDEVDEYEEFDKLIENSYILQHEKFFIQTLDFTSIVNNIISLLIIIIFIITLSYFKVLFIVYFWMTIVYIIISFRTNYLLSNILIDQKYTIILTQDLMLLITLVLNIIVIITYPIFKEDIRDNLNFEINNYFLIPNLIKLPFSFINYYLASILGTYYKVKDCLDQDRNDINL